MGGVAATALGASFWSDLFGAATHGKVHRGPGYGPLRAPDDNGIRLPEGFSSRVVARGCHPVTGTSYQWHIASTGRATFPLAGGGWILVPEHAQLVGLFQCVTNKWERLHDGSGRPLAVGAVAMPGGAAPRAGHDVADEAAVSAP